MIFHLTSATHYITSGRIINAITCSTCNVHCLQNMDVISRHLSISYQKAGCCQRSKTASYNVCTFFVNPLRFLRSCKSFIVTVGIINAFAVFFIFSALCIAVFLLRCICCRFFHLIFDVILMILCGKCHGSCACCKCSYSKSNVFLFHGSFLLSLILFLGVCETQFYVMNITKS